MNKVKCVAWIVDTKLTTIDGVLTEIADIRRCKQLEAAGIHSKWDQKPFHVYSDLIWPDPLGPREAKTAIAYGADHNKLCEYIRQFEARTGACDCGFWAVFPQMGEKERIRAIHQLDRALERKRVTNA